MNERHSQITTGSQQLRSVACANARAIFGKRHIAYIVQTVFNPPVSTAQFQQVQRCIRPSRQDADEVNDLDSDLALLGTRAGELGNMADPWPIDLKIGTQLSAHLDEAALEAPTLPIQGLGLLDLGLRIGKVSSQIGLEGGFIAFDHKERIGVLRTQEPP